MNRYVITTETIGGQEYRISALYDEKKRMIEALPQKLGEEDRPAVGNIYIGRVENVVKNLNAAFVKISPTQNCYLSLEDVKHPVFTKKISGEKKLLAAGDELLVQVVREALKTKEPAVTTNLSMTGTYAVLTSGNRKMSVSQKLTKDVRRHYKELLTQWLSEENGYGVIIRTNAGDVPEETVHIEIEELKRTYAQLAETARHKTCYSLLYREESAAMKHLRDLRHDCLEEIVTDDGALFAEICKRYGIPEERLTTGGSVPVPVDTVVADCGVRICHYRDELLSLSALYGVKSQLEAAFRERVWLKSGAYLVIQPTEALTVIDVNTGKNIAKKDAQENFLKIDQEAAVEIARQLRLRNISGIIVVDFINLVSEAAREELVRTFRAALKSDPIPAQLIDITKLGLVEVTRKKVRKPLFESFEISSKINIKNS